MFISVRSKWPSLVTQRHFMVAGSLCWMTMSTNEPRLKAAQTSSSQHGTMGITEQLTHKVTSWCGNAFGITDPLWEESTGNRWIPHAKGQYCGAWTFPLKLLNKRTGCRRFETHQRSCDVTVKTWLGNDTSIKLDCHECMILNMCAFRGLWHRKRFWNKKKIENSKLSEN